VTDRSFDTIIRDATTGISRRRSLVTLGAAGVVAALASPFAADAKQAAAEKKGRKKRKRQSPPPPDRCAPQVEPCTVALTNACGGDPGCQDSIACCSHLGTCDGNGFFDCLLIAFVS